MEHLAKEYQEAHRAAAVVARRDVDAHVTDA
jgi:hypothetical protein